jgi:hypothetical protein
MLATRMPVLGGGVLLRSLDCGSGRRFDRSFMPGIVSGKDSARRGSTASAPAMTLSIATMARSCGATPWAGVQIVTLVP